MVHDDWTIYSYKTFTGGGGGREWSSLRYWSSLQNDVTIIYNKAFILFIVSKKYSFKCQSNVMLSIYLKTYITCTCFRFWPCDHWAVKGFFLSYHNNCCRGFGSEYNTNEFETCQLSKNNELIQYYNKTEYMSTM